MRIVDVICSKGRTGFFFDDQQAIKKHAIPDGANYHGTPITPGFSRVRQAGESISVMLVLEDRQLAWGDCAAVQYSGIGGRDPLFRADDFVSVITETVAPLLRGRELNAFKPLAEEVDRLTHQGRRIHVALRYGITQAILDAVAKSRKMMMAEVIAAEYQTRLADHALPILTQSGDNRYDNADKMIMKRADALPHGLFNHVGKLGENGELLLKYVQWLKYRVKELSPDPHYEPVLHLDVYGAIGVLFNHDHDRIIAYFYKLERAARPYKLRIEGPVEMEDRESHIIAMQELTRRVDALELGVEIVADEWCNTLEDVIDFCNHRAGHMIQIKTPDLGGINNTIEAVRYCQKTGILAYQGGSCNETERSAQVCVHMAMAVQPDLIMAKPGMGVDEGYMITFNEMQRILAMQQALVCC